MPSRVIASSHSVWLGLGGNVGDVQATMAQALQGLDADEKINVRQVSRIYRTPPWGVEDQPWFLNCCAEIHTSMSPEELLEICQMLERQGRRERVVRWGPRTIDIDIIAFEAIEQVEQRLTIPHPRATERAFVILPLSEIAPDLMLAGHTVAEWRDLVNDDGVEIFQSANDWWRED